MTLLALPNEIVATIAVSCQISDVLMLRETCRSLNLLLSIPDSLTAATNSALATSPFARQVSVAQLVAEAHALGRHLVWGNIWVRVIVPILSSEVRAATSTAAADSCYCDPQSGSFSSDLKLKCAGRWEGDQSVRELENQLEALRSSRIAAWRNFLRDLFGIASDSSKTTSRSMFVCWGYYNIEEHWLPIFRFSDVDLWCEALAGASFECHRDCYNLLSGLVTVLPSLFIADARTRHIAVSCVEETRDVSAALLAAVNNAHTSVLSLARLLKRVPDLQTALFSGKASAARTLARTVRRWSNFEQKVMHVATVAGFAVIADSKHASAGYRSLLQVLSKETREALPATALSLLSVTVFQLRSLCENEKFEELLTGLLRLLDAECI